MERLVAAVLLAFAAGAVPAQQRPNVILIMSDDMGYSDIGCYGSEIRTPNLDSLAAGGLRFSQFYNGARCCPTRSSLLTGLYAHQTGVGHMLAETEHPGYRGQLNASCRTIAEVLRGAGYRTYMSGKWHVTRNTRPGGPKDCWPLQRGFDRFYGTIIGAGSFYDPATLCRGNTFITPENDPEYQPETFYYTDAISDQAVRYVTEHVDEKGDQPFFMYVAYTAAHWPMQAHEEDIARYRGRYDAGFEAIRRERLARLKQLGLVADDVELSPGSDRWADVPEERRAWEARNMEAYAAMVESMDRGIGDIVRALRQTGQLDGTLILFLQDNGGCAENFGRNNPRKPYPKYEPLGKDGLQTKIWPPMQTRDGRPVRVGPDTMPGADDTFTSYGRGWANVSNTPFREYKHWVHEGGIATPFIAHWPNGIAPAQRGRIERQPGHLIDVMATCVDVSAARYPKDATPLEGASLTPSFTGEELRRQRPLFWEHEANCAMRDGRWKIVCKGAMRNGQRAAWELYDLEADRAEANNLADDMPERVEAMAAAWEEWALRAHAKPWPWLKKRETFSAESVFRLGPGAVLDRGRAPHIEGRGFEVVVDVASPGTGVLVAQGGSSHGWSIHADDTSVWFSTRRGGRLTKVRAGAVNGAHRIRAVFAANGGIEFQVGDGASVTSKALGPIQMPADGLEVGRDLGGLVGEYDADNSFGGVLSGAVIQLR